MRYGTPTFTKNSPAFKIGTSVQTLRKGSLMTQDELKQAVAKAAITHVPAGCIVGVGTGSTANFFIDELGKIKHKIDGAVASSEASAQRLRKHGIEVLDLKGQLEFKVGQLPLADEVPIGGVVVGPRNPHWRPTEPATLVWVEALSNCAKVGARHVKTRVTIGRQRSNVVHTRFSLGSGGPYFWFPRSTGRSPALHRWRDWPR